MKKVLLIVLIITVFAVMYSTGIHNYLTLNEIKAHQFQIQDWVESNFSIALILYFIAYTLITALALPFAAALTVLAGFIFGTLSGLVLISFASTLGASGSFLISRYLARDYLRNRFHKQWRAINSSFNKDGTLYLFFLRLVPVIPFFLINIGMGLTSVRLKTFYWVSQLGMLPGTILYVNAGSQLASIDTLSDVTSPKIILSFLLLAIFPFLARHAVQTFQAKKTYKDFVRPKKYDFNVIVIGGGSAGLVSAYSASMLQAKTALVEKDAMGGDCLNTGCVPSKALLRSAKLAAEIKHSHLFGLQASVQRTDMDTIMDRVHAKISAIAPNDSVDRYTRLGVHCLQGDAIVHSPWQIEVNNKFYSCKNIIIATGARPRVPDISGIESVHYYTTDTIWQLNDLPERLLIVGGGPIGCELGQAFARLGSDVIIVEAASRVLVREDEAAAELVQQALKACGVQLYLEHTPVSVINNKANYSLALQSHRSQTDHVNVQCTHILLATGRIANLEGLEKLRLETTQNGQLKTNEYLQTRFPNVYACGDVVGPYQYTHAASNQAWYAAFNALFSPVKKLQLQDDLLPRAVFTDPEIASIGIDEQYASDHNIEFEVTTLPLNENDRSIVDNAKTGFIKVLTSGHSDRILGVTIVGEHASELIGEFLLAMNADIGLNKILHTIHIYPTRSEIARQVAGEWRRKRFTDKAKYWLKLFHQWRLK